MGKKQICQALVFLVLGFLEFITIELFFDHSFTELGAVLVLKNAMLYWVFNLILVSLFHWMKPAFLLSSIFVLILGIANYLLIQFRGYGIVFMDLYAVRTAAMVAGHYTMEWKPCFAAGFIMGCLTIFLCFCLPQKSEKYFQKKTVSASLGGLMVSAFFIFWMITSAAFFRDIDRVSWDHQVGMHDYGYALYFAANIGTYREDPPPGYSTERAEQILSRYLTGRDKGSGTAVESLPDDSGNMSTSGTVTVSVSGQEHPNLIMIMNESFADLRVLGEKFSTDREVMPFYDSLTENTVKGYAEASVYGGYTSGSEFEFLTGCTKAFLPGNPYLQYMTGELPNLISVVKSQKEYGEAVAMHPYHPSGYNRNRVYPLLSFDRFLSLEDWDEPELLRKYVSDVADYRQIYWLYEEKPEGSRLCLFNVTMQNHGSYRADWVSDDPVHLTGTFHNEEVEQYLSLIKKSDDALRELIAYFQSVPEPTLVVFFGDHQPHLPDAFYGHVMGKLPVQFTLEDVMKKHKVPYLLWANYDIPEQTGEEITSLNYLSLLVLRTAGLPLSAYQQFLLDVQREVPVLSAIGYQDGQGKAGEVEQADGETAKWLEEYEVVQYYYLFDSRHRLDRYFTIL